MVSSTFDKLNFSAGDRYPPRVRANDILRTDEVGVRCVVAALAAEYRTLAITFLRVATFWTTLGCVGRRHFAKLHSMFFAKLFKPKTHLSHCPVGETLGPAI